MGREKGKVAVGQNIAIEALQELVNRCKNDDELAGLLQMMCALCVKTIHGMEGSKFKKDFLRGAMADPEKITPQRVQ